jgi:polysaccharide biosynthesis protein PslG
MHDDQTEQTLAADQPAPPRHRLRYRITNLALIACLCMLWGIVPPYQAAASGELAPQPLDPAPFGINTHLATRTTDLAAIDRPAELVAQAGAGWAREDIHWYRVQPTPDTWDWGFTDAAIRALVLRGIKVVGVIGHPPGWATTNASDAPDALSFFAPDPQQYAAFAQAVAVRYSRYVSHWEIWNEPDNPAFWKPTPDPSAYANLLMTTSAAIRAAAPQARILIGGVSPFDTHFLQAIADAGAWSSFDILAIHPYVNPAAPEAGNLVGAIDSMRALSDRYGARPIWVTEIGWASSSAARPPADRVDQQTQASYLVRATLILWRAGVERIFWYNLKDDPEGDTYGMVALGGGRDDFSRPKPAYYAFQTLSRQLSGTQYTGIRDLFERTTVLGFEPFGVWIRGDQPNGRLVPTSALQHSGTSAAQLSYSFPTRTNDYVVFRRAPAAPTPSLPYAVGAWVYGDSSGHTLKIWLRDGEGEILQYTLGSVGPASWRFLQARVGGVAPPWDRITTGGNGQLDAPVRIEALVLDDAPDSFAGIGTIYIDDITVLSGPEAYNLRLRSGDTTIDLVWAAQPMLASISSRSTTVAVIERDGQRRILPVAQSHVIIPIGPSPVYIRHSP